MPEQLPKVSIIMPVYNGAKTVGSSLQSLFNQTLRDIEVIAVDDASTDNSGSVLDEAARRDMRLTVIHLPANVGVHEARSAGILSAKAPWIGFLDADDFAKPVMFEKLYQAAVSHEPDICICGSELRTAEGERLGNQVCFPVDRVIDEKVFESFCQIKLGSGALWNKLYRAELVKRWGTVKFRWRQDASEDTLVNVGCFLDARKVCLLNEVLHEYVQHSTSVTATVSRPKALVQILRAYAVAIETYGHARDSASEWITELYRKQLIYDEYQVAWPTDLGAFRAELTQALSELSRVYPEGLAVLASKEPQPVNQVYSFRSGLNVIFHLFLKLPSLFAISFVRRLKTPGFRRHCK